MYLVPTQFQTYIIMNHFLYSLRLYRLSLRQCFDHDVLCTVCGAFIHAWLCVLMWTPWSPCHFLNCDVCRTQLKANKELTEEGVLLSHNHDDGQDSGLVQGGCLLQDVWAEPYTCEWQQHTLHIRSCFLCYGHSRLITWSYVPQELTSGTGD